ncbi:MULTISPECIES: hypothetical protein [unclassified Sinorhizobium]|uniref:hypothetical protein n=1 Tax=unclassified Sinorhizobium TaxID=2613772 RepID=UPI0024C3E2B3|nr:MULTISPECIES: hypothetical protein [unclassified Sinorhizobium]MDK1374739.1 hypothetical protein [Sinorhizobium sp. 6-70]MDK1479078.1 hypothetical protein [Sinorhizobium sp. 6-117]
MISTRRHSACSIKRTVSFDGVIPVYHLYYGAKNGDPSTIVTTFLFKKPGICGKRGTNQSKIIQLPSRLVRPTSESIE